jgi:hypothetical protein
VLGGGQPMRPRNAMAYDAAGEKSFAEMFPGAADIKIL